MKKGSATEKRAIIATKENNSYIYTSSVKALEALTGKKQKTSVVNDLNLKLRESDVEVDFLGFKFKRAPLNKMFFEKEVSKKEVSKKVVEKIKEPTHEVESDEYKYNQLIEQYGEDNWRVKYSKYKPKEK